MTARELPDAPRSALASLPAGEPLAVQYLAQVQYLLPAEPSAAGGRAMRAQLRSIAAELELPLLPSRRETAIAFRLLARHGLLLPRVDLR